MRCPICQMEYDETTHAACPNCGAVNDTPAPETLPAEQLMWSLRPGKDTEPPWPKDGSGRLERAVLLTGSSDLDGDTAITVSMLRAFGVPTLLRYPKDGQLGKVLLGFSGYGADLFVPESQLELARELISPGGEMDPSALPDEDGRENDTEEGEL